MDNNQNVASKLCRQEEEKRSYKNTIVRKMATSGELCPHISKLPTGSSHPDPIGDFVRLNPVILDLNISYR